MTLNFNANILIEFENNLDPNKPDKCKIPARILGFGEISTVLEIGENENDKKFAYKRMPLFYTEKEVKEYIVIYKDYHRILGQIGIETPNYDTLYFKDEYERIIFYGIQEKVNYYSIGNRVLQYADEQAIQTFIIMILKKLKLIFVYNNENKGHLELGIDGQISNWSLEGFDPNNPTIDVSMKLIYFDTSTPLIKRRGAEQLNPELFLRSAPSFLVWLIRLLFLKDVMNRYYDFRLVTIDLIANIYKEQRPELVPGIIDLVNRFFVQELTSYNLEPISIKEVKSYYKEDALIWRFYLGARKIDRWLHKLFRKPYLYILPGKIKR